jgi:hypothetical protein
MSVYHLQPYLRQYGSSRNRFGGPLSGNPNPRVLFGSPTGGMDAPRLNPKFFDPMQLGGKSKRNKRVKSGRGKMDSFINPNTLNHTYPRIGSVVY